MGSRSTEPWRRDSVDIGPAPQAKCPGPSKNLGSARAGRKPLPICSPQPSRESLSAAPSKLLALGDSTPPARSQPHTCHLLLGAGLSRLGKTPTPSVIDSLMTLLGHRWIDELRWSLIMLVSQTQLKGRLKRIHATGASAEAGTSHRIDLPRCRTIVTMDGRQRGPHGEINMVSPLDVHGHPHRRGVGDERVRRMVSRHQNARADWLLSEIILQNQLLNALHHLTAKEADHRQVHARIHQTERIASGNDTIKGW